MSDTLERAGDNERAGGPRHSAPGVHAPSPVTPPPPAPSPSARRHAERPFKVISLVGLAVLVGFIAYAVVSTQTGHAAPVRYPVSRPHALPRGALAPPFTLPRLGGGASVSQATADGEPAMVNFFASWCSNCQAELRAVATVAGRDAGKVAVIGIDTSDPTTATAQRLLSEVGATYPVGVDPQAQVAQQYRITGLPVTYFLDAQHRVVGVAFGAQTTTSLDRWAHRLTGGASG